MLLKMDNLFFVILMFSLLFFPLIYLILDLFFTPDFNFRKYSQTTRLMGRPIFYSKDTIFIFEEGKFKAYNLYSGAREPYKDQLVK